MKWLIAHIFLFILGLGFFTSVLMLEIDGILGFLLATCGVCLMGLGLTLKNVINFFTHLF